MTVFGALGRILGFTLLGAIAAPLVFLIPMMVVYAADSRCGTPGDSGGCEMGIAAGMMAAVPVGAALGLAFGVWRVFRRRAT